MESLGGSKEDGSIPNEKRVRLPKSELDRIYIYKEKGEEIIGRLLSKYTTENDAEEKTKDSYRRRCARGGSGGEVSFIYEINCRQTPCEGKAIGILDHTFYDRAKEYLTWILKKFKHNSVFLPESEFLGERDSAAEQVIASEELEKKAQAEFEQSAEVIKGLQRRKQELIAQIEKKTREFVEQKLRSFKSRQEQAGLGPRFIDVYVEGKNPRRITEENFLKKFLQYQNDKLEEQRQSQLLYLRSLDARIASFKEEFKAYLNSQQTLQDSLEDLGLSRLAISTD